MFKKIWKWIMVIVIFATGCIPVIPSSLMDAETGSLNPAVEREILEATVQITMLRNKSEEIPKETFHKADDSHTRKFMMEPFTGTGTLISFQGEVLIISHNHWSLLTSSATPDVVQFHDAQGAFLHQMDGEVFKRLVLFHDEGTLILRAPVALVKTTSFVKYSELEQDLGAGDVVHVVYHPDDQTDRLSLLAVEIEAFGSNKGVPVFELRSLDGQPIDPGDSGGGVWANGHLVGNLWLTVRELHQGQELGQTQMNATPYSYAAELTDKINKLIQILVEADEIPVVESGGPS